MAHVVNLIWDTFTSVLEGIMLAIMLLLLAPVALITWPAQEIWISWSTYFSTRNRNPP